MTDDLLPRLEACPNPWCSSHDNGSLDTPFVLPPHSRDPDWRAACPVCPIKGPHGATEAEAIAAWNTRPKPALAPTEYQPAEYSLEGAEIEIDSKMDDVLHRALIASMDEVQPKPALGDELVARMALTDAFEVAEIVAWLRKEAEEYADQLFRSPLEIAADQIERGAFKGAG